MSKGLRLPSMVNKLNNVVVGTLALMSKGLRLCRFYPLKSPPLVGTLALMSKGLRPRPPTEVEDTFPL